MTEEITTIALTARAYLVSEPRMQMGESTLKLLRCPYKNSDGEMLFEHDSLTEAEILDASKYIPLLMSDLMSGAGTRTTMGAVSLMVGLHQYGCLPAYHATEDGARDLAIAVIMYVGDYTEDDAYTAEDHVAPFAMPYVCAILNTWLKPSVPWSYLPGVVTLCRHLFGSAWCSLNVPEDCFDEVGAFWFTEAGVPLVRLVRSGLAPFQEGLCQEYDNLKSENLPGLECAP